MPHALLLHAMASEIEPPFASHCPYPLLCSALLSITNRHPTHDSRLSRLVIDHLCSR